MTITYYVLVCNVSHPVKLIMIKDDLIIIIKTFPVSPFQYDRVIFL